MTSSSPFAERDDSFPEPEIEVPAVVSPTSPIPIPVEHVGAGEFIFGRSQLASLAFIGILIITIMSAIAYFAGRKNTSPQVSERVIERIVQVPAPATAVAPAAAVQPVSVPQKPSFAPPPSPTPAATPAKSQPVVMGKVEMMTPAINRAYLQLGSVEIGVAEVIVEGLRQRGVAAFVGTGINGKVARILAGPFTSPEEQRIAQQHIEELGFHPFPRTFSQRDLEPQPEAAPAPVAQAPVPQQPAPAPKP